MCQLATPSEDTIKRSLNCYLAEIDQYLQRSVESRNLPTNLLEACRYAVLAGGKRLRPLLTTLSCEAVGGDWGDSLPAAAATEFIHAFSLVHDDLPAMDDDDLRRGKPTLHIKYGEAMAILAGDALQSLAFELLCDRTYSSEVTAALIAELSDAATRMIAGQVYDTLGGLDINQTEAEQLETIHRNKTGALIRASCRMGAIVAGEDGENMERMTRFGEAIGLMFQVVDDLLDVTQSAEHIGKAAGKDVKAGKKTFPGIMGIESTQAEITRLHSVARNALEPLGQNAVPLLELCDYLAVRTK